MGRFILLVVLALVGVGFVAQFDGGPSAEARRDLYLGQLRNSDAVPRQIREDYTQRNTAVAAGGALWVALAGALYSREIRAALARQKGPKATDRAAVA